MSMTDPVADLLTRLRNASSAKHTSVTVPKSALKLNILRILKDEGFIRNYQVIGVAPQEAITVTLGYDQDKRSLIRGLKRVSRPGCRIYVNKNDLPSVQNGLGIAIVSTSRGVLSDSQARQVGVGGEFLCEVW